MKIRQATEADILKVSRLWLAMAKEKSSGMNPNILWWRDHASQNIKQGNYLMLVADQGGAIVGFVDYFIYPEPTTSKIHAVGQHFYVIPACRGNGVSGKLWRAAMEISKEQGAEIQELSCEETERELWEKHGFKPVRTIVRKEGKC